MGILRRGKERERESEDESESERQNESESEQGEGREMAAIFPPALVALAPGCQALQLGFGTTPCDRSRRSTQMFDLKPCLGLSYSRRLTEALPQAKKSKAWGLGLRGVKRSGFGRMVRKWPASVRKLRTT